MENVNGRPISVVYCYGATWGCESEDVGASMLQTMLVYGSLTRITAPPNKSSAIDLTLSSSDLSLGRHSWKVLGDAAGSDHLPILSSLQTLEIPTKYFSRLRLNVLESLVRITDEMSLCGAYAIFMEIISGAAISAQTRTPGGYRVPGVQKTVWCDTEYGSFVTQVARRVRRLTLIVKRTCGIYANGKRRKRDENTAPYETQLLDIWKMKKILKPAIENLSSSRF
jgi:hypothetical protein